MINCFSFCMFEIVFISYLFLKNISTGIEFCFFSHNPKYRCCTTVFWLVLFLTRSLSNSYLCSSICNVSFFLWLLLQFSLYNVLKSFLHISFAWVCWTFWICRFMIFINFETFQPLLFKYFFVRPFSLFGGCQLHMH